MDLYSVLPTFINDPNKFKSILFYIFKNVAMSAILCLYKYALIEVLEANVIVL